jgi:hypothetical protein
MTFSKSPNAYSHTHQINFVKAKQFAKKTKASLNFDSNTSGSPDKPLSHENFKSQNVNGLNSELEIQCIQSPK